MRKFDGGASQKPNCRGIGSFVGVVVAGASGSTLSASIPAAMIGVPGIVTLVATDFGSGRAASTSAPFGETSTRQGPPAAGRPCPGATKVEDV